MHTGEEPPIVGSRGTAAVFFAGCSLRCAFCQNYQLSHHGAGRVVTAREIASRLEDICRRGAQTVSLVTPDHFAPDVVAVARLLRERGVCQPIVINCSGYQSIDTLRVLEPWSDVYLPDFKFAESDLSSTLAGCPDYPAVALDAIGEMVRQKGHLRTARSGVAVGGVLVRHLMLPGHTSNSVMSLRMLAAEFGPDLPLSLMSQYVPTGVAAPTRMRHGLAAEEFAQVYREARGLGFSLLYVQPLRWGAGFERLPDFSRSQPFPVSLR